MQTNVALFLYLEHHGESQLDWELEINVLILGVFQGGTSGKGSDAGSPLVLGVSPGVGNDNLSSIIAWKFHV